MRFQHMAGAAALALFACGCGVFDGQDSNGLKIKSQLSEDELRGHLNRFFEMASAELEDASQRIARQAEDPVIARRAITWKARTVPRFWEAMVHPNPVRGAVDLWVLVVRNRIHFEEGPGKEEFGPLHPIALEAARKVEELLLRLPQLMLEQGRVGEIQAAIEKWVREHPDTEALAESPFESGEAVTKGLNLGPVNTLVSLPLAPFKGLAGVSDVAGAVHHVASTGDRATLVARHLPRLLRLQIELLLLNATDFEVLRETRENVTRVATSFERISKTAETLPEDVQKTIAATLEEFEKRQPEIRDTLATAEEVVSIASTARANLEKAGAAWERTFDSITRLKGEPPEEPRKPSSDLAERNGEEGRPFDIREYDHAVATLGETAEKLRETVAEVERMKLLERAGETARATIDRVTWRLAQLLILFFALLFGVLVGYAFLRRRLTAERARTAEKI